MKQLFYVILLITLSSCKKIGSNHVLYFNKMNFQDKITFGDSSDVIIKEFPKNNISISIINNRFSINVKEPVYLKLNDNTQNIFDLSSIDSIIYRGMSISKTQVDNEIKKIYSKNKFSVDNQNYLPLKYFLLLFPKIDSSEKVKSIISHDLKKFILLDDNIHLVIKGKREKYQHNFSRSLNSFKIEFYDPIYWSTYRGENKDENYFVKYVICACIHKLSGLWTKKNGNE